MKSKDIKFLIIFIFIISLSLTYLFQTSYAKYRKKIEMNTSSNIAGWNIELNNETIYNKKTLSKEITPILIEDSNTKEGVIAPGTEGYFDLIINASKVDVSFNYEILPTISSDTNVTDFKPISYKINPIDNESPIPFETSISGIIEHNITTTIIRIYVKWDEDETQIMTNEDDTKAGATKDAKGVIKTSIKFNQINN